MSDEEVISFKACQIAGHCRQPLSRVCVADGCRNSRLLCYTCQKQSHAAHKTLSLGQFIQEIRQKSSSRVDGSELLKKLDFLSRQTDKSFELMTRQLVDVVLAAKGQFQLYYSTMNKIVSESQNKQQEFTYDHRMPAAQLQKYMSHFVDTVYNQTADKQKDIRIAVGLAEKVNGEVNSFLKVMMQFTTNLMKKIRAVLDESEDGSESVSDAVAVLSKAVSPLQLKADQNINISMRKSEASSLVKLVEMAKPQIPRVVEMREDEGNPPTINNLSDIVPDECDSPRDASVISLVSKKKTADISPSLSSKSQQTLVDLGRPFRWSMTLHHGYIDTLSPTLACRNSKPGNTIVAILGHQRLCTGFKHKWRLTLTKVRGFVFVGICKTHKVQQYNFTCGQHWIQEDNGLQIVGTDGFLFTGQKNGKNHTKSGLKLVQNGKGQLNFVYDPQAQILTIQNGITHDKIDIKVSRAKEDNYRLCVFMQQPGDTVQLTGHSEPINK